MLRYLLNVLLAVSLVLSFVASSQAQNLPDRLVDDGQLTQLIVIGQPGCAPDVWFKQHPGLVESRKLIHFQLITPESNIYKQRYKDVISGTPPMVLWQRADGGVIYAAAGGSLPTSGQALFNELQEAWNLARNAKSQEAQDCPDGNCDWNNRPTAEPVNPFPIANQVKTGLLSKGVTWLLIFAFCLVGAVIIGAGCIFLLVVLYFASKLIGIRKYV